MRFVFLKTCLAVFMMMSMTACGAEKVDVLPTETAQVISAGKVRATLTLELALTKEQQVNGLMGRRSMSKDHGMIFITDQSMIHQFWMKDTLIPLDMIFLDEDGRIVKIHEKAKPKDETLISSDFPVRAVVELNAGAAKQYHMEIGDLILSAALDHEVRESRLNE